MSGILHGLDMFHLAILTEDTRAAINYEAPEALPGAVNVSVKPNAESESFYADNGAFDVFNSLGDIDVSMEVASLPLSVQKKIYGHKEENGVLFDSIEDKIENLALGFRAKLSTGGYRYYWLLKGKPQLLESEHQTDEGKTTPQPAKVALKFMPLQHNGRWRGKAEDGTTFTEGGKWFNKVVYEGAALTEPTGGTGVGGDGA